VNDGVALALAGALVLVSSRSAGARRDAGLAVGSLLALVAAAHLVASDRADANLLLVFDAALIAVALALAMLHEPAIRGMGVTDLVVDLGPQDALGDLERRDPTVRDDPAFIAAVEAADRLVAANDRLIAELGRSIDDVAASRGRLIAAQDRQRAALENRLQRGPAGRLDHISATLATQSSDVPAAAEDLHAARELVGQARADLTRIAQGLYPAAVADGSLESALHEIVATSSVPVDLDLQVTRVSPPVAATTYYVAAEAVTNAVRHAAATRIGITVRRCDDLPAGSMILIEVVDDGRGGADSAGGTGLLGLADRVATAGGAFEINSVPGRGTRVAVSLPERGPLSATG
jgi:signal transduction histidine kinase